MGVKNKIIWAVKVILAVIISVTIAIFLKLDFAVSTGIIAILTIQPTKSETVKTAFARFIAFLVALGVAAAAFVLLGVNWTAFFVYLVIFVFVCSFLGWTTSIATCSVLVAHFLTAGKFNVHTVLNEVLIFTIGASVGILANLHLKKQPEKMKELSLATDEQIKKILIRMSERLVNNEIKDYDGNCFKVLNERIYEAHKVARDNYKNQFDKDDIYDIEYIEMRDRQRQVLYEMYKDANRLVISPITATKISDYLKNMAEVFDEDNDCTKLMDEFKDMNSYMKEQPLPVDRLEFENRACLYSLMQSIEEFISIKVDFASKYH